MWLPSRSHSFDIRDDQSSDNTSGTTWTLVWVLVASLLLLLILTTILAVRTYLRKLRAVTDNPKFLPGKYLKRRWREWSPGSSQSYNQVNGANTRSVDTSYCPHPATGSNATVDRHTSVRSVMTLPAYAPVAGESEQVIAREGERGGMDVVVEFPETVDEEEVRREEEMESLYQIRLARRREQIEREDRRRQRREARENHDWNRLEELRIESRLRARVGGSNNSAAMLAEHQARNRDRRISTVSYADIGLARADGTRVRPDSFESDDRPLLDSAASIGSRSRPVSLVTLQHERNQSNSGASMTSNLSDDRAPTPTTSHGRSNSSPLGTPPDSQGTPTSSSETNNPTPSSSSEEPPQYEEVSAGQAHMESNLPAERAPPYDGPSGGFVSHMDSAPQLPEIELPDLQDLPSIEIESATPSNSIPPTPIFGNEEDITNMTKERQPEIRR